MVMALSLAVDLCSSWSCNGTALLACSGTTYCLLGSLSSNAGAEGVPRAGIYVGNVLAHGNWISYDSSSSVEDVVTIPEVPNVAPTLELQ